MTYPVVDTRQVTCYDDAGLEIACPAEGQAFYGQDARHTENAPSYTDHGDGTVMDNVTGLIWSQDDSGAGLNWGVALAWAAQKNAEGYLGCDDWRLPDAKELQSIVDYTRAPAVTGSAAIDPVFNATAIVDEESETNWAFYWTSTTHANWTAVPDPFGVYVASGEALGWMQPPTGGDYVLLDVHGAGAQRSDLKRGDPADWPYGNGPQGDVVRICKFVRLVRDVGETVTPRATPPPTPTATPAATPTDSARRVPHTIYLPLVLKTHSTGDNPALKPTSHG